MKKLEIEITSVFNIDHGISINASGRQMTIIADKVGSTRNGTFAGGSTTYETAENLAEAINTQNDHNSIFGPIVVEQDNDEFINITFTDALVTSVTTTSINSSSFASATFDIDNSTYNYSEKIMARSPHFFEVSSEWSPTIDSAELHIYAYQGSRYTDRPSTPTYVIKSVATSTNQASISFNISEFAKSFFTADLAASGTQVNWNPFIDIFPKYTKSGKNFSSYPVFGVAYNGYGYFEDGVNPQMDSGLAQSNNKIIAYSGRGFQFPVDVTAISRAVQQRDGETVNISDFSSDITFSTQALRSTASGLGNIIDLEDLATNSGSEYFYNQNAETFLDSSDSGADTVFLERVDGGTETIQISYIKECKQEPIKLTFTNKYGALQSVWFFKNNKVSMKVKEDSFRRNTLSQGIYSGQSHQYKNLYKSGKQSIDLNSGFYPESYNEVFRQMMLSQDVWLQISDRVLPVNISDSNIDFKTSINDKLIEYSIKCDFAFDTINSIN
tara:strand:- start:100 stop:1596 length:1497 start_codon:yes stop_codon:yes gene_type:complete